jgi:hypothetical protein
MRQIPNANPALPPSIELTPVEARQGVIAGRMIYVLGISLTLSLVTMGTILSLA